MQEETKKLLEAENIGLNDKDYTLSNAKKAKEKLGVPVKLYLEMSKEFYKSELKKRFKDTLVSIFMAGFIAGWRESKKNN